MAKKDSCIFILFKMLLMILLLLAGVIALVFYVREKLNEYFNRGENIVVPDFRERSLLQVIKEKPSELIIETKDEKFDLRIPKDHVISQEPPPGTKVKPNKKIFLTISKGNKQVTVPELKEKNIRETGLALLNAQLKEGNRSYLAFGKIQQDRVISQYPLHPSKHEIHGNVDLLISLGSSETKTPLPNFIGKQIEKVKETFSSIDLTMGKTFYKHDPMRHDGEVIMTSPPPYDPVEKGEVVFFLVSSGEDKGNASPQDLKKFFVKEPPVVDKFAGKEIAPPRIILPNDDETVPEQDLAPDTPAIEDITEISFMMPEGFLPKEVKFILQSPSGRREIYSGIHRPNEQIRVKATRIPGAKVQIYINNVPVEERILQ